MFDESRRMRTNKTIGNVDVDKDTQNCIAKFETRNMEYNKTNIETMEIMETMTMEICTYYVSRCMSKRSVLYFLLRAISDLLFRWSISLIEVKVKMYKF